MSNIESITLWFVLWIAIVAISLTLVGCGGRFGQYTIFLEEKSQRVTNLKGEECLESGYIVEETILITHYKNCEVQTQRILDEREIKQWLPTPKRKTN